MKKRLLFAMMGAIALTGPMVLSSCSSEDEVADVNPTYNSVTNEVTTQFVLNVAAAPQTRMSSATVQRSNNFRGLNDARLIGLSTGKASSYLAPYNGEATSEYTVRKTYVLGQIYGATAVDNSTATSNSSSSSNRVLELSLPLTTDAMLVYARAIASGTDEDNGKVTMDITTAPEESTISLCPRLADDYVTRYTQTQNLAALIVNRLLLSEIGVQAAHFEHNTVEQEESLPALSWRQLGKDLKDGVGLAPLQENLAAAYNKLVTFGTDEVRAGSASAICSIAYNIYKAVESCKGATATNDEELNAQRLALEIEERLKNYFDGYTTGETATKFRNIGDAETNYTIINGLVNVAHVMTAEQYTSDYGSVLHGDLMGFPTSFGLPLGVAQLHFVAFDEDNLTGTGFSYKNPGVSLIDLSAKLDANRYMYPSELLYFDNSLLRVSSVAKAIADYPNGYNTWDTNAWSDWSVGPVVSTTRSVAVKNNINYGVAMLQTKVALDGSTFIDNRNAVVPTEGDQELTEADVKKFQLKGVLIGGQNNQVGWNYLYKANTTTTDDWSYVIYDNKINGTGTIPTGAGEENYTLVFDNYHPGTKDDQADVLVALEFVNNGKDFYGKGNMIREGGTFYLIGKLTLGSNTISNWDNYYPIPPYTAAGASQEISRVFVQDYMTTATFKIGANSLKNAFVTVPDLRSSQTSLGLSVDLNWQTGLNFETVLGQ